ncbi:P-loop containing nucleoside triphosphate hydrolase protein [Penicillium chermesinum]|nr:P-loop containing nucleoside triphosphate hydrolase protein [Penicillium chermesinum]
MSTNYRSDRLAKYFAAVLHGKQEVRDLNDFKKLIEAILDTKNPCLTVERLIASQNALNALQMGLRFNLTPSFTNNYTSKFINFLSSPGIKLLCNGLFLTQLLLIIWEPRSLWNSLLNAFHARQLDENATRAFCWLTTELLSLPTSSAVDIVPDSRTILSDGYLLSSSSNALRNMGQKIKYLIDMKSSASTLLTSEETAGGRHDNDFTDFRLMAVFPTTGEMCCTDKPFYRRADEIIELSGSQRIAAHVDNQFRLLREDMLSALRDDIQIATGAKKGRRSALRLKGLSLAHISCTSKNQKYLRPCTVGVTARSGLERLKDLSAENAKEYLRSNTQFVKHRAFGCFLRNTEIVAFATIERNIDDLLSTPPVVMLRVAGEEAVRKAILFLKLYDDVEFLVVDTATFAYEPILRCLQTRFEFPLTKELFLYERGDPVENSSLAPWNVINKLHENCRPNIQTILGTAKPVALDRSQSESLLAGLTQRVSLIQGPPRYEDSKRNPFGSVMLISFIGALLAKILHDQTNDKILVMCYTNHALDQFLEDLLDIGIGPSNIVRLGSKSTGRTQPLSLQEQNFTRRRSQSTWYTINALESQGEELRSAIDSSFAAFQKLSADSSAILDYLEFEAPEFFEAFTIPEDEDGMSAADRDGKAIKKGYLYDRWIRGQAAKPFVELLPAGSQHIWALEQKIRDEKIQSWKQALLTEQAASLAAQMELLDKCHEKLSTALRGKHAKSWKEKES